MKDEISTKKDVPMEEDAAPKAVEPAAVPDGADDEPTTVVKFGKPFSFEGKTYTEVDLQGLENLTAEDMIAASNYLTRKGNLAPTQEMNIEYACFIASRATGHPVEFFRALPLKEATKVKNRVTNFFYSED